MDIEAAKVAYVGRPVERADRSAHKAIDYINRLNNYDTYMHVTCRTSPITVGSELYEKALVICVEHQEFRLAQICAL